MSAHYPIAHTPCLHTTPLQYPMSALHNTQTSMFGVLCNADMGYVQWGSVQTWGMCNGVVCRHGVHPEGVSPAGRGDRRLWCGMLLDSAMWTWGMCNGVVCRHGVHPEGVSPTSEATADYGVLRWLICCTTWGMCNRVACRHGVHPEGVSPTSEAIADYGVLGWLSMLYRHGVCAMGWHVDMGCIPKGCHQRARRSPIMGYWAG
jgi:hypothetical protein